MTETAAVPRNRIAMIDILRGFVIVLMALDHTREFTHDSGWAYNALGPEAHPAIYATRWITHLCAPTFVLLAGVSIRLQAMGGLAAPSLSARILKRGFWLIFLELTVIGFIWSFSIPFLQFWQVIWAIGWSMVLLAPLTLLPSRAVLALGVVGIAGHNLLDGIEVDSFEGPMRVLWSVLHEPAMFVPAEGHMVRVGYPLLPWLAVMCFGYGLGEIWTKAPAERRRLLVGLGVVLIAAFLVVRGRNGYGDPDPWAPQDSPLMTVASFLNCQKYPPSLDYLLMTLGPILVGLALLESERTPEPAARVLDVFGRVPLFFYVAHLYLLRPVGIASAIATLGFEGAIPPEGDGSPRWPLGAAYVAWLVALAVLYPACRWYGDLKKRRQHELTWLRYL